MCPLLSVRRSPQTVPASLLALLILSITFHVSCLIKGCVSERLLAETPVGAHCSKQSSRLTHNLLLSHAEDHVTPVLQGESQLRQIQSDGHGDGDGRLRHIDVTNDAIATNDAMATDDTIAVADSLVTQQRIARLHEHFQQEQGGQDDDLQSPPSPQAVPPLQHPPYWPPNAARPSPLPDLDAMIRDAGITTDTPFLFIGILSSRRTSRRRITVTNTWLQFVTATNSTLVEARFVLTPDEANDLEAKVEEHILYANAAVTYSSILIKVYVMFEHALKIGARWLLKTDDDAYVNIPQTVQNLLQLCTTAKCNHERAYLGTFIGGAPVMMEAKHKWHNEAYIMHAAVTNYPPYALGGGYILSFDILKVLVSLHRSVSLTFTAIEDANVGMWLAGMNITRHNWEGVMSTAGWTCCFSRTQDKSVRSEVLGRYTMSNDPCRPQRVVREIHMHESIQELLERSAKVQSDEVGQALDLSEDEAAQEAGGAGSEARKAAGVAAHAFADWDNSVSTGWRRTLSQPGAADDRAAHAARQLQAGQAAEGGEAVSGVHQDLDPAVLEALNWRNLTLFAQTIAASDREGGSLRTRPMVLHKVANPLHMYYLHWRLQHCSIPKKDLIAAPGEALALRDLPSLHEIFHITTKIRGERTRSSGG
eukprot:jgi/Ulvmu1/3978/UM182_0006.1